MVDPAGPDDRLAPENPVTGAIHTVAAHPENPDILFIGGVNGGIWRTENASDPEPIWIPLTDHLPSLSIGALEFDPTDPTHNTLVAGIGRFSSFTDQLGSATATAGGPLTGLLKTIDGGETWTTLGQTDLDGLSISGVGPRGETILVSAAGSAGVLVAGLYRSTGGEFDPVSGSSGESDLVDNDADGSVDEPGEQNLPLGAVFDLVGDPGDPNRFYAGIAGLDGGIFRSDDAGAKWVKVIDPAIGGLLDGTTNNIELAVHHNASEGTNAVYVGIVNAGQLRGVFRSENLGASWQRMDLPQTLEGGGIVGIHPGRQGAAHFSIAADPVDPNFVYVGGDRQPGDVGVPPDDDFTPGGTNSLGASRFVGRLFRGDASIDATIDPGPQETPSPQWTPLTHIGATPIDSAPHPDSREMVFDARGDLIEVDDGGVYRRTMPDSVLGGWSSLIGNLQVTEFHDVAWDSNSNIIIGGNQDNGVTEQTARGSSNWSSVLLDGVPLGDGGDVAIDTVSLIDSGQSIRYSSGQDFGSFRRRTYDVDGRFVADSEVFPALDVAAGDPLVPMFVTPFELNANDPTRLLVGAANALYESIDQGETLVEIFTYPVAATVGGALISTPLVYGGIRDEVRKDDVLYVASHNLFVDDDGEISHVPRVFVRGEEGGPIVATPELPLGTGFIRDIVADPDDWTTAFITDGGSVFMTTDAGASPWEDNDITGNLPRLSVTGPSDLRALALVPGDAFDMLVAAGAGGIFATTTLALGVWVDIGGTLPHAPVWDLDFHADDDEDDINNVLLAGTLGRGAWTLFDTAEALNFTGRTGDVIAADIGSMLHAADYELTGAEIVGTGTMLSIVTEAGTGDLLLTNPRDPLDPFDDEVVARAILSERAEARGDPLADGDPFATTGRLYLAPSLMEVLAGDEDPAEFGFQGTLDLTVQFDDFGTTREYVARVVIDPGISTAGEDAVTIARTTLDALRVEQRLNFFAFPPDVTDEPLDLTGTINFTTGALDTDATAALQLFQAAVDSGGHVVPTLASPPLEQASGLVDLTTAGWLNAANAPRWSVYEGDVQNSEHEFGTSWLVKDVLQDGDVVDRLEALATFLVDDLLTPDVMEDIPVKDISAVDGRSTTGVDGGSSVGRKHQAGMEVDFQLPADLLDPDAAQAVVDLIIDLRDAADDDEPGDDTRGDDPDLSPIHVVLANLDIVNEINDTPGLHGVATTEGATSDILHVGFAAPALDSVMANEQNLLHGVLANLRQLGEALDQAAAEALAATIGGDIPFVSHQLEDVIALDQTFQDLANSLLGTITITGTSEPGLSLGEDVPLLISIDGQLPTVMTSLGELPAVVTLPAGDYADATALETALNVALAAVGLGDRLEFSSGSPLTLSTREPGMAEFLTLTTLRLSVDEENDDSTVLAEAFGQFGQLDPDIFGTVPDDGIGFTLHVSTLSLDGTSGEEVTMDFDSQPIEIRAVPPDPEVDEILWPHTQDNATLHEFAADLNAAFKLVTAGDLNHLDDDLIALVDDRGTEIVTDDLLVIAARNPDIVEVSIAGAEAVHVMALGFSDDPDMDKVVESNLLATTELKLVGTRAIAEPQYDTIYGLIDELALALDMTQEELDLEFDPATNSVLFNVVVDASFSPPNDDRPQPVDFDLTNGTGQVAVGPFGILEFTANADATFTANVALNFRLGIFLGDLAEDFVLEGGDQSTPLAELNAGEGVELLVGVTAEAEPSDVVGEDDDGQFDSFNLTINDGPDNAAGGGSEHSVVVDNGDTLDNFDIFDLADDLNAALATAGLAGRVEAGVFVKKTVEMVGDDEQVTDTSGRLTLTALDPAIHSLTIADGTVLGFGEHSSYSDLTIKLERCELEIFGLCFLTTSKEYEVDLDGARTIQDVIYAIEKATDRDPGAGFDPAVSVDVGPTGQSLRLTAERELGDPDDAPAYQLTVDAGEFKPVVFVNAAGVERQPPDGTIVPAGIRSLAGMGLGILGRSRLDESGVETGILEGSPLDGRTFADRLFLVEPSANQSTVTLNVEIDVPNVDLRAAAGEVLLNVTDTAQVAINVVNLPLRLTDPGSRVVGGEFDGRISLRELFEADVDDVVDLPAAVDSLVTDVSGTLELSAPMLDADIDALPGTISLSLATANELASAQFSADPDILGAAISQLEGFTIDSLVTLVESFVAGLRDNDPNLVEPLDSLNLEIPLLSQSLGDVVTFTGDLQDAMAALVAMVDLDAVRTARDVLDSAVTNLDIPTVDKADLFDAFDALNAVLSLPGDDEARQSSRLVSAAAELRKVVSATIAAEPGSSNLESELDSAMMDLEVLVPSLNTLATRLGTVTDDQLPGVVGFDLDIVDYSDDPGAQLAVVVGLTAVGNTLVAENFSPQILTDRFGPINIEPGDDFTLRAGGSFAFGFGVNLANNAEAFVVVDPPGGSGLTRTALNLNAGFDGTFAGLVQFGALDRVDVNSEFSLLSSAAPSPNPDVDRSAVLANRATLAIDFGTPDTSDNLLGAVPLSDLFGEVAPVVTIDGELDGSLDAVFQGEMVENAITVSGNLIDLAADDIIQVNVTDLENLFREVPFDLTTITDGIDALLDLLEDGLTSQIVAELPLIGDGFDAAGTFIGDLRAKFGTGFNTFLSGLNGSFDDVEREVRTRIFEELGPDGLDILADSAETDVVVTLERDVFEIRFKLTGDDRMTVDFDSGLGGLPITAQGGVSLGWRYDIDFGVGVDRLGGFYFRTKPGMAADPEFMLTLDAGLIVEDAGGGAVRPTTLSIDLLGLKFSAEDIIVGDEHTRIGGVLMLDVKGSADSPIVLNDLARMDFTEVFSATLDADFDVMLKLGASVDATLPSISTNLIASGGFSLSTAGGPIQADFTDPEPFVRFEGIKLDLGDFLSKYIGPAIVTVNDYLEPIRPVLDVLTTEVPGVSELSELAGQGPVTFLDVALLVSDTSAEEAENVRKFVNVVAQIADVVDAIDEASAAGEVMIDFGDLDFGTDANLANPGWNQGDFGSIFDAAAIGFMPVDEQIDNNAMGRVFRSLTRQPSSDGLGGLGIGLDFLEPANIFRYLISQPADVLTWDIPRFDLRFEWEQEYPVFPVPPIVVEVGLNVSAFMDLSVGYDTRGVLTGNFADGFFFGDRADVSTGRDVDEFGFGLGVTLAALLDVKLAEAGIEGEVRGDVTANWRDTDNDGKLYLDELATIVERDGIDCIFDLEAVISAIIRLVWEIDLLVDTVSGSHDIIDVELVRFSNEGLCPEFEPAHVADGTDGEDADGNGAGDNVLPHGLGTALDGTLIIHAGHFAGLRQPGSSTDTSEQFTVTEVAPGVFDVEGMGLVNRYSGAERIFFDGGMGADELKPINARPGPSSDEVTVPVTAFGGDGHDVLIGGREGDTIVGGDADDIIDGLGGNDMIFGGEGPDTITGGEGADTIDGGGGEDDIRGEGGNDNILGGPNDDTITGDDGLDIIDGNAGRDTISGGPMSDFVHGGSGDDVITGDGGGDFLHGDSGHDRIDGDSNGTFGDGGDPAGGDDFAYGGEGNDLLVGNFGTDILLGGWGNDVILAHLEGSVASMSDGEHLEGGPDDDFICGTDGADDIFGGTTDTIFDVSFFGTDTHLDMLGIEPGDEEDDFPPVLSGGYNLDECEDPPQFTPSDPVTIQGRKFRDDDGDGRIDAGEPGLNGWTIDVIDDRGDLVARTTTADVDLNDNGEIDPATETGVYRFDDLDPGSYSVREVLQPGFRQTLPMPAAGETTATHELELPVSGQIAAGINFGNQPLGSIHGVKWDDLDRDGVRDPGEPGMAGVLIYDDENDNRMFEFDDVNDNGLFDEAIDVPHELFTRTMSDDFDTPTVDETGMYWLEVEPGRHFIREMIPLFDDQSFPPAGIIYENDFEAVADEWSKPIISVTLEGGREFLGPFTDEPVTLRVNDLPTHEHLTVEFDLFVIGTWEGNKVIDDGTLVGPDRWQFSVRDGASVDSLLDTTFSNLGGPTDSQSFPAEFGAADNPPRTDAVENNTLGFGLDSVYHLEFTFTHTLPHLRLDFAKLGLDELLGEERWGLDKVVVFHPGERHIVDLGPGEVVEGRDFGNAHGPTDTVPPSVPSVMVNDGALQRSMVTRLAFQFNEDVSGSLDVADLVVTNVDTGQAISTSAMALTYDTTNTATWTFPGLPGGTLADGNYRTALLAASITDPSGNALDGDGNGTGGDNHSFEFFRFFGDADGDRDLDFADLFEFQSAFPTSSTDPSYDARFDGDADGDVDFPDLFAFNNNFQQVLPPPVPGVAGDYNGDGVVDTADYVVWRKNLGGTTLLNDGGISPGIVDQEDYIFWRSRFGATSVPVSSLQSGAADEAVATQTNGGGHVHGTKWDDQNANGLPDAAEPGVAGVTIYSDLNNNDALDAGEPFTTTMGDDLTTDDIDETGMYWLDVPFGTHIFREVLPEGRIQTFPWARLMGVSVFSNDTPPTLFDISTADAQLLLPRPTEANLLGITVAPDGRLFGLTTGSATTAPANLFTIDTTSGAATLVTPLNIPTAVLEGDLDFDPTTGLLYAMRTSQVTLFTIDPGTGNATPVGSITSVHDPSAMAFDAAGNLYVVDPNDGLLLRVDKSNATILATVPLSEANLGDLAAMDFDPVTGQLLLATGHTGTSGSPPRLFQVDVTSGTLTTIGTHNGALSGLAFVSGDAHVVIVPTGQPVPNINFGNVTPLVLPDGDDELHGQDDDDTIYGDNLVTPDPLIISIGGSDLIFGQHGNDMIFGQDKADVLWGFEDGMPDELDDGDDIIDGGVNSDDSEEMDEVRQTVDAVQILDDILLTGQGFDSLVGIEAARLTGGAGGDTIDASMLDGADARRVTLIGAGGSDMLIGSPVDDTFVFGTAVAGPDPEEDTVMDSGGIDTLDFSALAADDGVTVALALAGIASHTNRTVTNLDPSAYVFENVIGGAGMDNITGNEFDNVLLGGPNDDTLLGEAGLDTLVGGGGDDTLEGGTDDDTYIFGLPVGTEMDEVREADGADGGIDALDFSSLPASHPLTADLSLTAIASHTNGISSRFVDCDDPSLFEDVLGGAGDDEIAGNDANNLLAGGPGSDTLSGEAGSDTLDGGAGNDFFVFGTAVADPDPEEDTLMDEAGVDTLDFSALADEDGVTVALALEEIASHTNRTVTNSDLAADVFENVVGGAGMDNITGNEFVNDMRGGPNDDTLNGGDGNDILDGGAGNDTLSGDGNDDRYVFGLPDGTEMDMVDDSDGIDTLDFGSLPDTQTLTVDLSDGTVASHSDGGLLSRTVISTDPSQFENAIGGAGHDFLTGNDNDNRLDGGDGTDEVRQTANVNQTLSDGRLTGQGIDTLINIEAATLTGGPDGNIIDASDFTWPVTLIGGEGNDELIGGRANDTLVGGAGENTLIGGPGDDTYVFTDGVEATDTLEEARGEVIGGLASGGGSDTLDFGAITTPITFDLSMTEQDVTDLLAVQLTDTTGPKADYFENVIGGQSDDDTLVGPGDLTNTWRLSGSNQGSYEGNLDGTILRAGTFSQIENLTGGSLADTFVFEDQASVSGTIDGGEGDDTLDYSLYTTPVEVDLIGNTATGTGGILSIEAFVPPAAGAALRAMNTLEPSSDSSIERPAPTYYSFQVDAPLGTSIHRFDIPHRSAIVRAANGTYQTLLNISQGARNRLNDWIFSQRSFIDELDSDDLSWEETVARLGNERVETTTSFQGMRSDFSRSMDAADRAFCDWDVQTRRITNDVSAALRIRTRNSMPKSN